MTTSKSLDPLTQCCSPLSAITVKVLWGMCLAPDDLMLKGYKLNNNYKQMNPNKLFLSTVNSSKGLERICHCLPHLP